MNPTRRDAFTLIELLVVITIIGILTGMLLPVIMATREAGRRVQCVNRLSKIGFSLQKYESAHGVFPSGTVNPEGPIKNAPEGMHHSWLARILPYVDEQVAFKNTDFSLSVYEEKNAPVRNKRVPAFACPSKVDFSEPVPSTSYAGCHHDLAAPIDEDDHGVLFLNSHIAYEDITDGMAYTIMVGEKTSDANDLGWMSGTYASLRNMGGPLSESVPSNPAAQKPEPAKRRPAASPGRSRSEGKTPVPRSKAPKPDAPQKNVPRPDTGERKPDAVEPKNATQTASVNIAGSFGSYHTGLVNFLFADGSVQSISTTTNQKVLQQLAHRADGQMLNWPMNQ